MTYCLTPKIMANHYIEIDTVSLVKLKEESELSNQALANRLKVSISTIKRRLKDEQSEDRKEVLSFAQKLAKLAGEVPEGYARLELNKAVIRIQQYKEETDEGKIKKIFQSLKSGATTVAEIVEDCDLSRNDVETLLDELIKKRRITRFTRGGVLNRGRKTMFHYAIAK